MKTQDLIEITDASPWDKLSGNAQVFDIWTHAEMQTKIIRGTRVTHCPLCYGYALVKGQSSKSITCPYCLLYARKTTKSLPWIAFQRENAATPYKRFY